MLGTRTPGGLGTRVWRWEPCCLYQEVALIFMGNESLDGAAFSQVAEGSHGFSGEPCLPCPLGQRFPDQVPNGLQEKHRAASSLWA